MAYDGRIMQRALARFDEDKQRRSAQLDQRRRALYAREPRLAEIETELRGTMSRIISSALARGTDPLPAIRVLRDENLALQQERTQLLAAMGYPADYLEEKPACRLCGDTGYANGRVCGCLRAYYAREQLAELSRLLPLGEDSFETFSFDWYDSAVQPAFGVSPRANMERNFDVCRDYAYQFAKGGGSLLLSGGTGLGKTFLSACIARVVSENGFSVVYDTAASVFARFEDAKFRRDEDGGEDADRCMRCDLLILDDLGTEMTTSFVQSALYQIVNGRLMEKRSTIISTNLAQEEIGSRYGQSVLSRLEGEYEILPFFGEDIRTMRPETRARIALLIEGHVQYAFMTIEQIERFYARFYPRWNRDAYYGLMEMLKVAPRQRISRMSCGQRSQVALGLILAQNADLLVLDDFSMGLDPGYRRLFVEYLRDYAQSEEKTVFLTSHIIQDMEKLVDDCIIMDYGSILVQMPVGELLGTFRRYTFTPGADVTIPAGDGLYHPSVVNGRAELYSFDSPATVQGVLERAGIVCSDLRGETLNLEDAFIGLTGKY